MAQAGDGQLLTLAADGQRFGVPARIVREVARMSRLTPVPHAPPAMLGLANVRGTAMPVLSLSSLLGGAIGGERRLVVLESAEPVALAVDAIAELLGTHEAEAAGVAPIDALALVSRTRAERHRQARSTVASALETGAEAVAHSAVSLVTFAIGTQAFAFALEAVEEVLRLPAEIAAVPHADPIVVGSIAVRGALLPLLSLARLLALPGMPLSTRSRALVVRIGEHRVGLIVDTMRAVMRVDERDIDPVPIVLTRGDTEARIQAVCRSGGGKLVSVLAPEHLLRADLTAQLLGCAPTLRSAEAEVQATGSQQFLVFTVGAGVFSLPVSAVEQAVMMPATLARLPRSPAFVRGVMPLQGETIPIIDQAKRFGAAARTGSKQRVVVVKIGKRRAGFLVDTVREIRRVSDADLQEMPLTDAVAGHVIKHVVLERDEGVMLILSPAELLDGTERDLLRAMTKDATSP